MAKSLAFEHADAHMLDLSERRRSGSDFDVSSAESIDMNLAPVTMHQTQPRIRLVPEQVWRARRLRGGARRPHCTLLPLLLLASCTQTPVCTEDEVEAGNTDDCSVESELQTYTASGADVGTLSEKWGSGVGLRLEGDVREVVIDRGADDDEIVVTYRAEVELLPERPQSFVQDVMDELVVVMRQRGNTLVVDVSHPGTSAALGAHLDVRLPESFDGDLEIQKWGAPGDVVVEFLAEGRLLDVDMEAPSIPNAAAPTDDTASPGDLRRARLNAAGDVKTVPFTSSRLELVAINSERGEIDTAFEEIPLSHAKLVTGHLDGSRVRDTGEGIYVALPRDGDFSLATYTKRNARFVGAGACDTTNISSDIRLLMCGDGDPDGLLTFELVSSDEVEVELR